MVLDADTELTLLTWAMLMLPFGVFIGQPRNPRRMPSQLYVVAGVMVALSTSVLVQGDVKWNSPFLLMAATLFFCGMGLTVIAIRRELRFAWPAKQWIAAPVVFFGIHWLLVYCGISRGGEFLVKGSLLVLQLFVAYSCLLVLRNHWSRNVCILFLAFCSPGLIGLWHLLQIARGDAVLSFSLLYLPWFVPIIMIIVTCVSNMAFLGLVLENEHTEGMAKATLLAQEESRARMAEVLAQMDRSSNLNVISSSLGLQLSQPLAAIKLNTQLLQKRLARNNVSSGDLADGLDQVVEQVRVCARIVDQVRQFIKPPELTTTLVDLQQLSREVWDLLRQEAQQKGVQVDFPPELPGMYGAIDRLRTSQVLMNLLRSSSEGLQLGASGSVRLRFRRRANGVDVVIVTPWPQPANDSASELAVRLQAHAVVFQSRLVSAQATLAEYGATIEVQDVAPHYRELVLHFLGSQSPAGEIKMERA